MKKKTINWHSKNYYLIGKGKDGVNYYLEQESWDCGWYWGCGYIESFTNNTHPERSKDIRSHSHFDSMFMRTDKSTCDAFKDFFEETVLDRNEIWEFVDYMMTIYQLKDTARLFKHGCSWQTERAKVESIKRDGLADEINEVMLPDLFAKVKTILTTD